MDFETALQAKRSVSTLLAIGGERTRGPRRGPRNRVAVGLATTAQARDFKIAIRAQSQEDLDRAWEKGMEARVRNASPEELDIRITGPIVAGQPTEAISPERLLRIGSSVSHYRANSGTLGFFAKRLSDGAIGIVSNNHVLAACDRGKEGDAVVHPGATDYGVRPADVIGSLAGDYPRLDARNPLVDSAFARLGDDIPYDPVTIAEGLKLNPGLVVLREQRDVLKYGRTTGVTHGRISVVALDNIDVDYGHGNSVVIFSQQIEIESIGETHFSEPGDSGSLVVNPDGHPVGLLVSGTCNCQLSYASSIENVLKALSVTILT